MIVSNRTRRWTSFGTSPSMTARTQTLGAPNGGRLFSYCAVSVDPGAGLFDSMRRNLGSQCGRVKATARERLSNLRGDEVGIEIRAWQRAGEVGFASLGPSIERDVGEREELREL